MLNPASGRLRWHCRRGVKELDVLLTRFLDAVYPGLSSTEQAAFEHLLTLEDPLLAGYCLGQIEPPGEWRGLISTIAQFRQELN